jgi:WD40 repeat protein
MWRPICIGVMCALGWLAQMPAHAQEAPRLVVQAGHTNWVNAVAFSPDGKLVVSGARDQNLKLWDAQRGRLLRTLPGHMEDVESVSFTPDGKQFVSASFRGAVNVWDSASGKLLRSIANAGSKHALSRDGRTLVAGGAQGVLKVVDFVSGKELRTLTGHTSFVEAVAISADGKLAASGSDDKTVIVWDLQSGKALATLRAHEAAVRSLAFAGQSRQLISGGEDKIVRVWDAASGKLLREMKELDAAVKSIAVSRDGRTLAAAGDSAIQLWDIPSGKPLRKLELLDKVFTQKSVSAIAFADDGKSLVAGHYGVNQDDTVLRVWDVKSGTLTRTFTGHAAVVSRAAWSPDGKQIVAAGQDGVLNWWDLPTGTARRVAGVGSMFASAYSPDGKLFAYAKFGKIELLDPRNGKAVRTLAGHANTLHMLAFSPDGTLLASGGKDRSVRLWEVATGKELRVLEGHKGDVQAAAFSHDGKRLATAGADGRTRLWDVASGSQLAELKTWGRWTSALRFLPKGDLLMVANSDDDVQLWDPATGRAVSRLKGHAGPVNDIAFSPDGRLMASAGADLSVRLWDVTAGTVLRVLEGHQGAVRSARFSPDGKFLLSGSDDNSQRLWRVADGAHLASMLSFTDNSWVVADPAGRFDTSDLEEMRGLHWVMPADPFNAVPVEQYLRDYYEPRLLTRVLKGEKFPEVRAIATLDRAAPVVDIVSIKPDAGAGTVSVTVQVQAGPKSRTPGVQDLKLFRNGQLVGASPATGGVLKLDAKGRASVTFAGVQLGQAPWNGKYDFSAYAFNGDRVKSATIHKDFVVDVSTLPPPPKRRAYLLVIGVNAYENPLLDLKYAANDAASIRKELEARLQNSGRFEEVVTVPLVSTQTIAQAGPAGAASKANIRAAIDLLAGKEIDPALRARIPNAGKLRRASPDDVIFISFSGHGFYETGGDFFLLPTDVGPGKDRQPTDAVLAASISSAELTQWLRPVDGGNMALVIDACHSGAAVGADFKPGPMGSRGLGQLAFDKGMLVLAATQADNVALEAEELEHGYLSYALIQEGLLGKRADFKPEDGRVTIDEWLGYGAQRVPYLALEVDAGTFARGTGPKLKAIKRNLDGQAATELADDVQQPALFDFRRKAASGELILQ